MRGSLLRLFHKIRKNCYGDVDDDDDDDGDSQRNTRRTKPHEAALCEACSQGICTQKENDDQLRVCLHTHTRKHKISHTSLTFDNDNNYISIALFNISKFL